MGKESLGTDKYTPEKIILIFSFLAVSLILGWLVTNTTTFKTYGTAYYIIASLSLIAVLFDYQIKQQGGAANIIDSIIAEPTKTRPFQVLRDMPNSVYYVLIALLGFTVAFSVSSQGMSLVSVPTFQVAEFTETSLFASLMSAMVAFPESLLLCILFPSSFGLVYWRTKSTVLALMLAMLATAGIFTLFHFLVYGTAQLSSSIAVFVFGIRECVLLYLFRDSKIIIVDHAVNNFVASYFQIATIGALI